MLLNTKIKAAAKKQADTIKGDIKNAFSQKGIIDTGKASASLKASVSQTGNTLSISIEGLDRIVFVDRGRAPGKRPPIEAIIGWVKRKLGVSEDKARGIAFVVARKIGNEGTGIFNDNSKGLELGEIAAKATQDILKEKDFEPTFKDIGIDLETKKEKINVVL